jgi:hypothetical protein
MSTSKRPLMGTDNILELQDNGYKSSVSAISEIIDNSIQANATKVDVIIIKSTVRAHDEIEEILIIDNGDGMDQIVFEKALQMSSGNRSKAKKGLGKYGQGLPNSSISQTKRVEVYTKQKTKVYTNYIDLDEIYNSGEPFLPNIEEISKIDFPFIKHSKYKLPDSGTVVRWVSPNKVKPKTARTLVIHLQKLLGRTFRNFIAGYTDNDGKIHKSEINVIVYDYNGSTYEPNDLISIYKIKPFDPLFLMTDTQMNGLFPKLPPATSELYSEKIEKIFNVEYNSETVATRVEIIISYAKKEVREAFGRNAGGSALGKMYLYKNLIGTSGYENISIVREGREIDYGSFGFIENINDPRNRWWSVEILVEPVIDSIIGVDNKKQQASEIKLLDSTEVDYADNHEILRWISEKLFENLDTVKNIIDKQNASVPIGGTGLPGGLLPPGGGTERGDAVDPDHIIGSEEEIQIKKDFHKWIKDRYADLKDEEIKSMVEYALSIRDNHIFIKSDLGDSQLYTYTVFGTKVLIEINYRHSFYTRFMKTFEEDPTQEKSLRSIRLLIGSMVNSEIVNATKDKALIKDRRNIKNRMSESLDDYINDLYNI